MNEMNIFYKKASSCLPIIEKKIYKAKGEIQLKSIETELFIITDSLRDGLGDILCFSKTDPSWFIEKYKILPRQQEKFLTLLESIHQLFKQIKDLEKKIVSKKNYWMEKEKVFKILENYHKKIEKIKELKKEHFVDRKIHYDVFDTNFDTLIGKSSPWNILLEERRQLFLEHYELFQDRLDRKVLLDDFDDS